MKKVIKCLSLIHIYYLKLSSLNGLEQRFLFKFLQISEFIKTSRDGFFNVIFVVPHDKPPVVQTLYLETNKLGKLFRVNCFIKTVSIINY